MCLYFQALGSLVLQIQLIWNTKTHLHAFFMSNIFTKSDTQKLANNQTNSKQHPETELLLLENYSHSSSTLSSKIKGHILKNKQKSKCVFIHEIIKNRSHRSNISRPMSRDGHKYSEYKFSQHDDTYVLSIT